MAPVTTQARRLRPILLAALVAACAGLHAEPAAPATPKPAAKPAVKTSPPLKFTETERVLEVGYYRREYFLEFLFTTEGAGAVRIKNFSSSCPCTTIAMEKTSYYPGEKGMVAAVYDYAGEVAEPPVQIVHVLTDRAPQPILLRVVPRRSATGIWVERKELRWIGNQPRQPQAVEVEVAPEFAELALVAETTSSRDQWTVQVERLASKGRHRLLITPAADRAAPTTVTLSFAGDHAPAAKAMISLHPASG